MTFDDFLQKVGLDRPPEIALPDGHTAYIGEEVGDTEGSQSFSVVNGVALDQRLGFVAGSVIIDNNTSSYMQIPDATKDGSGRFVPPGSPAAIPILGHISRARINWAAPPGKTQIPAVAGESAQVVFLAAPIPPGYGIAAPSNQTLPWITPTKFATIDAPASGTVLIGGQPGQTVYLHTVQGTVDAAIAAGWWRLEDTVNSSILWEASSAVVAPMYIDFKGLSISPVGAGVKIVLSGAQVVRGTALFSQG